ncbi:hypothetical protein [Salimicrobium jeotgali]|uniref:hypothetical protein n=1 Tax=Salimicrobium jeotgali TaxID=1230341 RepID=UPI000C83F8B4|nr:hypothetical protein [Salimicrobium jeotgali]
MSVEIIIASVAAVAAFVTSGVNIFMLIEQKRSFKKFLEPLLVPDLKTYNYSHEFDYLDFYKVDWGNSEDEVSKVSPGGYDNTRLQLLNLGDGVAKDIELKIEIIDYEKTVESIKDSFSRKFESDKRELKVNIIDDPHFENTLSLKVVFDNENGDSTGIYPLDNFNKRNFVYLIPDKDQKAVSFPIPSSFMVLYNLSLFSGALSKNPESRVFPKLSIQVSCKDGAKKEHNFSYIYHHNIVKEKVSKEKNGEISKLTNWEFILKEN